jgi:hypothetical protein
MIEYLRGSEIECRNGGNEIDVSWKERRGLHCIQRNENIYVADETLAGFDVALLNSRTTVLLSLRTISEELRGELTARGIQWLDIERKERSSHGLKLGEEVAQYLRRYGVRFNRPAPVFNGPGPAERQFR